MRESMGLLSCIWTSLPFAAMVLVECTDVGILTFSKAAVTSGISSYVFVVYYNTLASLFLLPYYLIRRNKGPPLTFSLLRRFFLLGTIGSSGQIISCNSVLYSSPTLVSAIGNLLPVFTFLLAVIFGMEKLDLKGSSTQAKILGTVVSVCGAFSATLYKGRTILMASTLIHQSLLSQQSHWVLGGLLAALACFMGSVWNIAQKFNVEEYPEEMTIVFFYALFVAFQSAIISLIAERDINAWKIRPGIQISAILYTAVFASVIRIGVHTWCLRKKGPLYVAAFKPFGIAIAAVMSLVFLGETLHLGSLVGYFIITLGFYTMMWGQIKEQNMVLDSRVQTSKSDHATPLMQSSSTDKNNGCLNDC